MSVVAAPGFTANGLACGIKENGDADLSLVATADGRPVTAAGVFTRNLVTAAPVNLSRRHLAATGGRAAAVVLNSGNANACTGEGGDAAAATTASVTAAELGCRPEEVLVCSTGLIGPHLPVDRIEAAVPSLAGGRSDQATRGVAAAEAIMTTDTRPKQAVARRDDLLVGGMGKGAAMLAPNMATMLAVLTTNAAADPEVLHGLLARGVAGSFNRMTVDGCTSTNDTVLLLANGSGPETDPARLEELVADVCLDLATQMVGDAEGHTKVVRVEVTGAASDDAAGQAARKVAESQLVKCSWYGQDPYWGRVASDLGTSGVALDPAALTIAYGGVVVSRGCEAVAHDEDTVARHMAGEYLTLHCDLGVGSGADWVLSNDLTHAYVDENMGTS